MKDHQPKHACSLSRTVAVSAAFFAAFFAAPPLLFAQGQSGGARRGVANVERMRHERSERMAQQIQRETLRDSLRPNRASNSTENRAARAAFNQVSEDFSRMQVANLELLRATFPDNATALPPLDRERISRTMREINQRASRLRSYLRLPDREEREAAARPTQDIAGDEQLRSSLLALNSLIESFVNNPMFRNPNIMEADAQNPAKGRRDIDAIIELSRRIRQGAQRSGD